MPWPPVFGKVFMLPLEDGFSRRFYYLRLSITDVCNFRCTYCLPDGYRPPDGNKEGRKSFLSLEEIRRIVSGFAAMGTRKVRLTGGEPSLRRDFTAIIETVANTPGIEKVAMTTNGYRLKERAQEWFDAGLNALNVSVDSLDPRQFHQITGENKLAEVMEGIEAALAAGFKSVKINAVLLKGLNDQQLDQFLAWIRHKPIELRFIELMRMGHLAREGASFQQQFYGMPELLEKVAERHEFVQAPAPLDATALRYEIPGRGFFGVIANESVPFCRTCSRLRLSSTGWLHGCLSSSNRHYVGDLLDKPRHQALPALQRLLVRALADKQEVAFAGGVTVMKIIGG